MLIKYPRTYHLPWSPGATDDDKTLSSVNHFEGKMVVMTEKMDGENTTMYRDHIHARSLDSRNHPSRNWVKQFWGNIRYDIPEHMRICGENVYARHAIPYKNLRSYFYGFSLWYNNTCAPWRETLEWFSLLDIVPVTTIYIGEFREELIKTMWDQYQGNTDRVIEGYVIRLLDAFEYEEFDQSVAKWVRKGHVDDNDEHWMHKEVIPNELTKY